MTIISWNYHDDDLPGAAADITLNVSGLPAQLTKVKMTEWRCDETHSNAFTVWKAMGSPEKPTAEQHQQLEAASELAVAQPAADHAVAGGAAAIRLNVPRQGVSLVELVW